MKFKRILSQNHKNVLAIIAITSFIISIYLFKQHHHTNANHPFLQDDNINHHHSKHYAPVSDICIHDEMIKKTQIRVLNKFRTPIKEASLSGYRLNQTTEVISNNNTANVFNSSDHARILTPSSVNDKFRPIRIHADFSNIENKWNLSFPNKVSFIKESLIPTALSYFDKTLLVFPNEYPIIMPDPFICYDTEIPWNHLVSGIENVDLVVYVTATYEPDENYGAYALACVTDMLLNSRPVVGQINYNLAHLSLSKNSRWERLSTTLHEITHILGFSRYLYGSFVDEYGTTRGYENVVKEVPQRGLNNTLVIILPNVVKVAQEYYNCSEIIGQELENRGDSGSRASHWEQIVLKNEIMTAISTPDRVYSKFTLALLEGSGWYQVNYNNSQEIYWGNNKGCKFLEQACFAEYEEFCSKTSTLGCTFDGIGMAECGIGGLFFDDCLSYNKYSNGDCRLTINNIDSDLGEIYNTRSKCVVSDISAPNKTSIFDVRCYDATCGMKNGKRILRFRLDDGSIIECENSGEVLPAPSGWKGNLTCPNIDIYCNNKPSSACPLDCWENGECVDGECICYAGWTGNSCHKNIGINT